MCSYTLQETKTPSHLKRPKKGKETWHTGWESLTFLQICNNILFLFGGGGDATREEKQEDFTPLPVP